MVDVLVEESLVERDGEGSLVLEDVADFDVETTWLVTASLKSEGFLWKGEEKEDGQVKREDEEEKKKEGRKKKKGKEEEKEEKK